MQEENGQKVEIADDRELGLEDKKEMEVASRLTPEQLRSAGLTRMRELTKFGKKKGNPKDYVLCVRNEQIMDYERAIQVKARLPEKIEPGNHVWVLATNGELVPVKVIEDNGEKLTVDNGSSHSVIERKDAFPTGIPIRPTLVHKSQIRFMCGEKVGGLFWNQNLGMRTRREGV